MRFPNFDFSGLHFRNPFRRSERRQEAQAQAQTPDSTAARNMGGVRPTGHEPLLPPLHGSRPPSYRSTLPPAEPINIPRPAGVHDRPERFAAGPGDAPDLRGRARSSDSDPQSHPETRSGSQSRNSSLPPPYSGEVSPAMSFLDLNAPHAPNPDSPPPPYGTGSLRNGERLLGANDHSMPLGMEGAESHPSTPGAFSGSPGSMYSALDAYLDALPPLTRFPTYP